MTGNTMAVITECTAPTPTALMAMAGMATAWEWVLDLMRITIPGRTIHTGTVIMPGTVITTRIAAPLL